MVQLWTRDAHTSAANIDDFWSRVRSLIWRRNGNRWVMCCFGWLFWEDGFNREWCVGLRCWWFVLWNGGGRIDGFWVVLAGRAVGEREGDLSVGVVFRGWVFNFYQTLLLFLCNFFQKRRIRFLKLMGFFFFFLLLLQSWMMEVSMLGIYSIMILRSMRTALRVKQSLFLPNLFNFFILN